LQLISLENNQCLTAPRPFTPLITLNGSATEGGALFDGVGGLAAIGGARLLYEYEEPLRSQLLDMTFGAGGAYHMLKIEIEGDIDSSYGSGPSFMHTRNISEASWDR
jgi:hypothetical protein